ncbi:TetR/AcrR family transcriptional regulator [Yinghuangia seranimata]|uniref:TetR/AcrR family transcriptional regulator n=1 Tax=Yinghuangia seranimata TaxID=408067 RepID=UPI00248B4532|nr:TetR/AcrR family transcriptional regulator [Yinghuangia seranimata]MDI2124607.1 TetR/AcrR family transcriptional regulator [Yinghuangia seranimata]
MESEPGEPGPSERVSRKDMIRNPRGRYAKGVVRRQQILDVALEVFATLGEKGALLKEVAERMGMSQAGVLHYFGSREGLLLWVLAERGRVVADDVLKVRYGNPLTPLGEMLRRNAEVPGLVRLHVSMAAAAGYPEHPAHDFFDVRNTDIGGALRNGLAKLERQGRIRPGVDLDAVVALALAAVDGVQHQWLIDPSVDMGGVIDTIVSLVVVDAPPPAEAEAGNEDEGQAGDQDEEDAASS